VHLELERTCTSDGDKFDILIFFATYLVTFTFTLLLNIALDVHICPCYTVKMVVKFFKLLFGAKAA